MLIRSFTPKVRTLLGPGPSEVHPRVLAAMAQPTVGHLDPQLALVMEEIKALLRYAFRTENRLTMPISGPGSTGMETCVVNLVEPGDQVVVCVNGLFGGRIKEVVERAGGVPVVVEDPWGRAVDPNKVEDALRAHPNAKLLAFVHAETSTGAASDAAALAGLARQHDCLTLVDAVTSLGGSALSVDEWGLDAVYSGSQKCLSCPPGLSPVTFSERALAKMRARRTKVQSWFMDLTLLMAYWDGEQRRTYHHTAPVNALYGLHEALLMLKEEGLENAWTRHRRHHALLRAGLEALGLSLIVPEGERLPQLNAVAVPAGVDDAAVRERLLVELNLELGAGLGALAGKVWRIGLMGQGSRARNVLLCIGALGTTLHDLGLAVDVDAALVRVQDALSA